MTIALIGIFFALAYSSSLVLRPKPNGRVVTGDALHHYVQLRSAVFDRDLHFRNEYVRLYALTGTEPGTEWVYQDTPTGHVRNLMPVGPALVWLPLFLLTTVSVWMADLAGAAYPLDGYGRLFQASAGLSGIGAAALGVWFTYLGSRRIVSQRAAIWGTLTLWLSSSAIYYSVISPTYSHASSLLATSAFWLAWIAIRGQARRHAALGALAGIAALMRWQDALLLAPIGLDLALALRRGEVSFGRAVALGSLALACAVLAFTPQMIVWTALYGRPLAMPQGEGFMRWSEPALVSVLFSDFHGLFTWTPIVLLTVAGLVPLWRKDQRLAGGVICVLLLSWYVNAAVADWWAGEAFGSRRFISCFPVFAFGAAALFERWFTSLRTIALVSLAFIAHTFLLLVQYQAFMHGWRDVAPYPRGGYELWLARFVVPLDALRKVLQ